MVFASQSPWKFASKLLTILQLKTTQGTQFPFTSQDACLGRFFAPALEALEQFRNKI